MLKNVDDRLFNLDGELAKQDDKDIPVSFILIDALMDATIENKKYNSGIDKLNRYNLAVKIKKGGDIEFKSDELAMLKELIGIKYTPLIVGQVYPWLDKDKEKDK